MNLIERPCSVVPCEWEHVEELAQTMDPVDVQECADVAMSPREGAWRMAMPATNKYSLLVDGRVAAIFGVLAPPKSHVSAEANKRTPRGEFFLLCGTQLAKAPSSGLTRIKLALQELLKHFDELGGLIPAWNVRAIRTVQYFGGELSEAAPHGPLQAPHIRFTLRG